VTNAANPLVRDAEADWPDPGPAWKQRARRLCDATAIRLARAHVPSALALLGAAGRAANFSNILSPSTSEVAALFHWLPRGDLGRVARSIAALHLKNRAAIALVQDGRTADLARLVRWSDDARRADLMDGSQSTVIAACHVGAFFGIRAALHGLNRPVFMMRDLAMPDAVSRASLFKRALEALRAGELVVATLDGPGGISTREVTCLGRHIVLRRGAFALARMTGARIVPVTCAWTRRSQIDVRIAPPINRPDQANHALADFEHEMAAGAARWLDGYLRAEPHEIWPSTLRNYLAAPQSPQGAS